MKPIRSSRAPRARAALPLYVLAAGLAAANFPRTAQADVVMEWNRVALDAIRTAKTSPPVATRTLALTQLAVYDAVNAIDGTPFQEYAYQGPSPVAGASREAAAAQAAYRVLSTLYPEQAPAFAAALSNTLDGVSDPAARAAGVALGDATAAAIIARRTGDGSVNTLPPFTGGTAPGQWRPTDANNTPGLLPNWGTVTPWSIASCTAFREAPPPALASAEYAEAFNEVKTLGSVNSAARTADQTQIALFWADGGGTATPPGHWNRIVQSIAAERGNSISQNARLFALLNLGMADAAICAWDMKYEYDFWRPVTAIHLADTDNNALTETDAAWQPLLATPPFPGYTSGHSIFSTVGAEVLGSFYGTDAIAFSDTSEGTTGTFTRSFTSLSQAALEAGMSRIYGGIHFGFDNSVSTAAGHKLGQFIAGTALAPTSAVPEPGTLVLLLGGVALGPAAAVRRRHKDRAAAA